MRAHARGRRRPREEPSLRGGARPGGTTAIPAVLPRFVERVARARDHLAHGVRRFLGDVAVVVAGLLVVVGQRRRLLPATRVLAAQDLLVITGLDPALQL